MRMQVISSIFLALLVGVAALPAAACFLRNCSLDFLGLTGWGAHA
jgi:hypothetical protein